MIPLLGFAPDADPTTPGVITDCVNFIPYRTGMEAGPSASTPSDVPALAAACIGAAVLTNLAGTRRILAGTTTNLYELSGGAWDDIGRVADYTGGTDTRWSFAQFGNTSLATNRTDEMQRSTGAGVAFADIASAPKAEIIFTVGSQVMALNVNDGAEKPDGWAVCAANDETDWTPSLTTLAAAGRLVSTPGALTAGARLGNYAVAYKAKSVYVGQFVGAPSIWDWQQAPGGDAGCVGKGAITDLGGAHFFVGEDDIYLFDGTRPDPVTRDSRGIPNVRQWFNDNCNPQYRYRTKCVFDRQNNRVWVFFPSNSATTCDSALVYHVESQKWGRSDRSVEAVLDYVSAGLTFDTWDDAGASYDSLPNISYDSQFWLSGGRALAAFDASHQFQTLTGAAGVSGFTTGDVGDDFQYSLLSEVRLRYAPGFAPTTASCQAYSKANSGDSYTAGPSSTLNDGKFDIMQEARWHQAVFSFSGNVRVTAGDIKASAAGER